MEAEALLAAFDCQMDAGLVRRGGSSLAMIPAFISPECSVPAETPVLVMDSGGTNLRVAAIWFDRNGKPHIEDFQKYPMPGFSSEVSKDEFFATLAGYLAPLARRAKSLGFCFSYPAEITPDCDGRLIYWTKQIKAKEVEGCLVGKGVADALEKQTGTRPSVRVLNDTVATLLAGKSVGMARQYSGYVGYILGTGTNTAYMERHERIHTVPGLAHGQFMAINVESGNFDGVPRSDFDETMDAPLPDKGKYAFEKMISGAYLGKLGLQVFKMAAQEGLFAPAAAATLLALPDLQNKDFDDFVDNPFVTGTALDAVLMSDDDRRTAMVLGTHVLERAAYLAGANIAAAVLRCGAGKDRLHPVGVTIDGSTYYRTRSAQFKSRIEQHLRDLLHSRGIFFDTLNVEDAPLIGAAVAGLS